VLEWRNWFVITIHPVWDVPRVENALNFGLVFPMSQDVNHTCSNGVTGLSCEYTVVCHEESYDNPGASLTCIESTLPTFTAQVAQTIPEWGAGSLLFSTTPPVTPSVKTGTEKAEYQYSVVYKGINGFTMPTDASITVYCDLGVESSLLQLMNYLCAAE
jgi:hypothetical protein